MTHVALMIVVVIFVGLAVIGLRSFGAQAGSTASVTPASERALGSVEDAEDAVANESADDAGLPQPTVPPLPEDLAVAPGFDLDACPVIAGLIPADDDADGVIESCWAMKGAGDRPDICPEVGDYAFIDSNADDLVDTCERPDPLCPEPVGSRVRGRQVDADNDGRADIGFEIDTNLDGDVDSCLRCPANGPVQLIDLDDDGIFDACQSREGVTPLQGTRPVSPTPDDSTGSRRGQSADADQREDSAEPTVRPTSERVRPTTTPRPRATPRPGATATPEPYSSRPAN